MESLLFKQVNFPQCYKLYKFGNSEWRGPLLRLTIEKDGSAHLDSYADGKVVPFQNFSRLQAEKLGAGAINLFSKSLPNHDYVTFHLQALVDSEPTIYHVDMDFEKGILSKYRVRGLKILAKWTSVVGEAGE